MKKAVQFAPAGVMAALLIVGPAGLLLSRLAAEDGAAQENGSKATDGKSDRGKTSSRAAIRQYQSAVALQNREVYDLAADQWAEFVQKFPDDPLCAKARHYRGICLFQLKKFAEAESDLSELAAKHPDFGLLEATLVNIGLAQFNQGQLNQAQPAQPEAAKKKLTDAAATFARQLKKFPDGEQAATARFYRAESLYLLGKRAEAIAAYRETIEKHAKDDLAPKALYGLGVALEEGEDHAAAGKTFAEFLEKYPEHALSAEVELRLAETELARGEAAKAEPRFAKAAAREGFSLADYATLRQAECLFQQKKFAAAAELYAALTQRFPKSEHIPAARLAAGKSYYLAGDGAKARRWLGEVSRAGGASADTVKKDGASAGSEKKDVGSAAGLGAGEDTKDDAIEAAHWIARSYQKDAQPAKAAAVVEEVLPEAKQSPLYVDLLLDQADALFDQPERRAEAIAHYAALAKDHPKSALAPQAAYMAAYASLGQKRYDDALKYTEEFLDAYAGHELTADVKYIQAESYLLQKKYAKAEEAYAALIGQSADRAEVGAWRLRRGLCLYLLKRYDEVVTVLGPHLTSIADADQSAEAHYLVGGSLLERKRPADAATMLRASLAAKSDWREADATRLALAKALHESGDTPGAVAALQQLLTASPKGALKDQSLFLLGQYHQAAKDKSAAKAAFTRLIEETPSSRLAPSALAEVGWIDLEAGEPAAAIDAFSRLLSKYPEHELAARVAYSRASAYHQTGKHEAALKDLATFLKSKPSADETADAHYLQGLCLAALDRYAEAAKVFSDLLANRADYAEADKVLYELAWAQRELDENERSAATFAQLAEKHPDSPLAAESLFRVGEARYQAKEFAQAAEAYRGAAAKAKNETLREKAGHKLAWTEFQQGDYAGARERFAEQVKRRPQGPLAADALVMSGECWFQEKQYDQALAAFEKTFSLKPTSESFQVLALFHAAQSASQLKKWAESLKLLERCATEFPKSVYRTEILYEKGWAKQNLGKPDEAIALFRQVADEVDSVLGARARFMAGEILFSQKKHDEAVVAFFKVAYGYGFGQDAGAPAEFHTWQADAMFEAGRCLEALKKDASARKVYDELIERFPDNPKAASARERVKKLGGSG